MNELELRAVECPYCGETIDAQIDCSVSQQCYIEDCQVCCRPINFDVSVDHDGAINVMVSTENE